MFDLQQSLVDLISEVECALTFQLQKFACLNEMLIAHQGNALAPMSPDRQSSFPSSLILIVGLSSIMESLWDKHDFRDYVMTYFPTVQTEGELNQKEQCDRGRPISPD